MTLVSAGAGTGSCKAGEACDEGRENGAGQACRADCQINLCGDGDKGPGEECDDGNILEGDGCTSRCRSEPSTNDGVPLAGPVAGDDRYSTRMGQALVIEAQDGILANDGSENEPLTLVGEVSETAGRGTLSLTPDGGFTYEPAQDYWGEDAFQYAVSNADGGETTATVRIAVQPTTIPLQRIAEGFGGFAIETRIGGTTVSTRAGDFNADGFADLLFGDESDNPNGALSGRANIVLGRNSGSTILRAQLTSGAAGPVMDGSGGRAGVSISHAGDIDGDGFADVVVGANQYEGRGRAYVVFGNGDEADSLRPLSEVQNSTRGFVIDAESGFPGLGYSVAGAGDVNGDGIDDIAVASDEKVYIVFGGRNVSDVDAEDVDGGVGGFVIEDIPVEFGIRVGAAGDTNGDGRSDILLGLHRDDSEVPGGGSVYVVYGRAGGNVSLDGLSFGNALTGFAVLGDEDSAFLGRSIAAAGDIDGDGLDDIVVGAPTAAGGRLDEQMRVFVVLGNPLGDVRTMSQVLAAGDGYIVFEGGRDDAYSAGVSVDGAGDVNGDGLHDIVIGAPQPGRPVAWVVFGSGDPPRTTTPAQLEQGSGGFGLVPAGDVTFSAGPSISTSLVGDVNGDGIDDVLVTVRDESRSYVLFGGTFMQQ